MLGSRKKRQASGRCRDRGSKTPPHDSLFLCHSRSRFRSVRLRAIVPGSRLSWTCHEQSGIYTISQSHTQTNQTDSGTIRHQLTNATATFISSDLREEALGAHPQTVHSSGEKSEQWRVNKTIRLRHSATQSCPACPPNSTASPP